MNQPITVQTIVNAPMAKVWDCWTNPEHIVRWAFASDDWEAPSAENDVRVGGTFTTVMAAKDKSASFDFTGTYTAVEDHRLIEYDVTDPTSPDGSEGTRRHVKVEFADTPEGVRVVETFDPEQENTEKLQRNGWQAILDNFRKYVENSQN